MKTRILITLLAFSLIACTTTHSIELYPSKKPPPQIKNRYVFLLILDGPRVDDMEHLVREGKLPTIEETFFKKGARYQVGTAVFPTSSSSGHQAILSGLLPGRNGIPGLSWLDRANKKMVTYLSPGGLKRLQSDLFNWRHLFNPDAEFNDTPQTLYKALAGYPTFNSFEQVSAGATLSQPKILLAYGWQYAMAENYEYVDIKAAQKTIRVLSKTPLNRFPRLTVTAFYSLDMMLHYEEPLGERVINAYRHIDVYLRELKNILKKKGILDQSVIVLTGDHGFHMTEQKTISLSSFLNKEGLTAREESNLLEETDAIVTGRAVGSNIIYLKKDPEWKKAGHLDDWEKIPSQSNPGQNILQVLLDHPAIEWLIGQRRQGFVETLSKTGKARVFHTRIKGEDYYQYQVPPGFTDPFKKSQKIVRQTYTSPLTRQKEGKLFEGNDHPDAIILASTLFDDGRGNGLYISLDPRWNIRKKKLGNHGTMRGEDIRVPFWFSGSGIQPGVHPFARTVDIYPTLLTLLGVRFDPLDVDGRILSEMLKEPPSTDKPPKRNRLLAQVELALMQHPDLGPWQGAPALKSIFLKRFSRGTLRGLRDESRKEAQRRLRIEKNIKKWEKAFLLDYGSLLKKSSAKAQKARQLARGLRYAKEKSYQARIRMESIQDVLGKI